MKRKPYSFLRRVSRRIGLQKIIARRRFGSEKSAAFIWIPKTAGTSMWDALSGGVKPILFTPKDVEYEFAHCGLATFGHQSYLQLVAANYISQEFHENAFKFCFVRNPFDRTVSIYQYLKKTGDLHPNTSFKAFCYLVKDQAFDGLGLFNHRGLSHCNLQTSWITDEEGHLFVDFIGRFEDLEKDFNHICKHLGISSSLPHLNKSLKSGYHSFYDEEECIRIVQDVYARDFEELGYRKEFEPSLETSLSLS